MALLFRKVLASATVLCAGVCAEAKVTFSLDFSLDSPGGLFDPATTGGQQARATMTRAAQVFSDRILDNLTAISPSGANTWTPTVVNPGTGALRTPAFTGGIGAGAIKLFVGSGPLSATEVGMAYAGTATRDGTQAFKDNADSRGQPGALTTPKTDYGPWGGSIAFDWGTDWNLALTTTGLTPNKTDLYTVALHELAHLLGFSATQPSYASLVSGATFVGPKAKLANGGVVAPSVNGSHWLGMSSKVGAGVPVQIALMDPTLATGVRRQMTLLDWAALDDIGWTLALPGDADANGVVGFTDYQAMQRGWLRSGASWSMGDFNEDGLVNAADFRVLYANIGLQADGGLSPTAAEERAALAGVAAALGIEVPEPGFIGALGVGLGWAIARRGRRGDARR
jgi:hypothetical protein